MVKDIVVLVGGVLLGAGGMAAICFREYLYTFQIVPVALMLLGAVLLVSAVFGRWPRLFVSIMTVVFMCMLLLGIKSMQDSPGHPSLVVIIGTSVMGLLALWS